MGSRRRARELLVGLLAVLALGSLWPITPTTTPRPVTASSGRTTVLELASATPVRTVTEGLRPDRVTQARQALIRSDRVAHPLSAGVPAAGLALGTALVLLARPVRRRRLVLQPAVTASPSRAPPARLV